MNVVILSDAGALGSGYKTLMLPLAQGLAEYDHEVKVIGLGYAGEEHHFDLSLIPAASLQEANATLLNIVHTWKVEVLIVALDIPIQTQLLFELLNKWKDGLPFKYVGIFPVEAGPLNFTWATQLMNMNKQLVISEFGAIECQKLGISAEHIQIGIDTDAWRVPTEEEKKLHRDGFGFDEDVFVVLTVADNQERKNLSKSIEVFANFLYDYDFPYDPHGPTNSEIIQEKGLKPVRNAKYIMVTREHLRVGWKLRDYAQVCGINPNLLIFERGLPFKKLWAMYAISDCFLLTSKAEGLGLPLLESMAVGVPCLATNCTAIAELLGDGRGSLIDYEYTHLDCFGNANRYWASREDGAAKLAQIYETRDIDRTSKGREYAESRTWDIAIQKLNNVLEELK